MAKSFGLGRGLDALLQEAEIQTSQGTGTTVAGGGKSVGADGAVFGTANNAGSGTAAEGARNSQGDFLVDIDALSPNPHQPRTEFDQESLQELADSIRENGVIQPPIVEDAGNGKYYIIAGERRTRAAKLAGLTQIPVRVQKYSEAQKLEIALIENIQREDLNPLEEALAYRKLMELGNITQDEVSKRVGKNRSTVANALRLLKLPEDMQRTLANGELTPGHARALLSVTNPSDQRVLYGRILGQNLSVREAERQAAEMNGGSRAAEAPKPAKPSAPKDPDVTALEQRLIEALGTKVSLKGSLEKGAIQIEYYSKDDLDRLFSIIV